MAGPTQVLCGTYSYCAGSKGNVPVNNMPPAEARSRQGASARPCHY
jgi:hypothetical protein